MLFNCSKGKAQAAIVWLQFLCTLALAIITFFYLRETKLIRKVAERSFQLKSSPKVSLESIRSVPSLNEPKKKIEVRAIIRIKNWGGTEASKFQGEYTISEGNVQIKGDIGPIPHLFPNQVIGRETKMFSVSINDEQLAVTKDAIETRKNLIVPKNLVPPIFMDLNLSYFDREGKKRNVPYRCKYIFHANEWVFLTD